MIVLAVDPGRVKCGIAVIDGEGMVLFRCILPTDQTPGCVSELCARFDPEHLVIGCGTGCKPVCEAVQSACTDLEPVLVGEKFTTLDARKRYFAESPPGGLWRLVPRGLLHPKVPVDDWAAVILGEQFLADLRSKQL